MQILLDKLMPALIANYISKLPCFEDKCGAEINDLAKLIHKYMSNDDLLIKALLAKQIDHDTISLIVSDLHLLINCLNNSEDLTLTNQNNFAVIKTADNNQKTPIKRLSVDKIKNLKIEICFNELAKADLDTRLLSIKNKTPIIEHLKSKRIVDVGQFQNSRLMYIFHDVCDHFWFFNFLNEKGLFKKHNKFFKKIGDPLSKDIFSRESELVAGLGFGVRRYLNQTEKYETFNHTLFKSFLESDQKYSRIRLQWSEILRNRNLSVMCCNILSNSFLQTVDERRRFGIVKILDNKSSKMELLDPDFIEFALDVISLCYYNKDVYLDFYIKMCLFTEQMVVKYIMNPNRKRFILSLDKINKMIHLKLDDAKWFQINSHFSTYYNKL